MYRYYAIMIHTESVLPTRPVVVGLHAPRCDCHEFVVAGTQGLNFVMPAVPSVQLRVSACTL